MVVKFKIIYFIGRKKCKVFWRAQELHIILEISLIGSKNINGIYMQNTFQF